MRIERCRARTLHGRSAELAVVIDVLRATSTAVVLLGRGLPEVAVVPDPAALERLPARAGGYLVVSELSSLAALPHRIDNSPLTARDVPLEGRMPVLVTTNGTRALVAASRCASTVLALSFLNLRAVAAAVRERAPRSLVLLPAGDFASGEPHVEDERCADALETLLAGGEPDLTRLLEDCRGDARISRRVAKEPGLPRDMALCLTPNTYEVIPHYQDAQDGWGYLRQVGAA
jgi:phosphosulfolactate phosphohydrolase-like enzyme